MSTSPSWFDKDKFSRLVKKVGTKTVPVPNPAQAGSSQRLPEAATSQSLPEKPASQPLPEVATSPSLPEKPASQPLPEVATSPSLPEKPGRGPSPSQGMMTSQSISFPKLRTTPSTPPVPVAPAARSDEPIRAPLESAPSEVKAPPTELRSQSFLPRRTSPLPALKDVFRYEIPPGEPNPISSDAPAETWEPLPPPVEEERAESAPAINHGHDRESAASLALAQSGEDLTAAWEKIAQLNDELAHVTREWEEAINKNVILQEDLKLANEKLEEQEGASGLVEELQQAVRERDEAVAENNNLREELRQAYETAQNQQAAAQSEELAQVTEERDRIRGDYVELRGQFESIKQEQVRAKKEQDHGRAELEQEVQSLRAALAERELELSEAQANSSGNTEELESLKQELSKTKNEASVAQRGLALSQKALLEAREAAASGSNVILDNLKKENATLVQQSMLLQAQHDQIARDLSAAKAKLAGR